MAIKFGGFSPEQTNVLLAKFGYTGPALQADEVANMLAVNPAMNKAYARAKQQATDRVEGKKTLYAAGGGFIFPSYKKNTAGNAAREQDNPEFAASAVDQQVYAVNKMQNAFAPLQDDPQNPRGFAKGGQPQLPPLLDGRVGPPMTTTGDGTIRDPNAEKYMGRIPPQPIQPEKDPRSQYIKDLEIAQNSYDSLTPRTPDPAADALNLAQQTYSDAIAAQQAAYDALAADPSNEALATAVTAAESLVAQTEESAGSASEQFKQTSLDSPAELIDKTLSDPSSLTTQSEVDKMTSGQAESGEMDPSLGDAGRPGGTAEQILAESAGDAVVSPIADTNLATTTDTAGDIADVAEGTVAAEGTVSGDAKVTAESMDPEELAQLELEAAQIDEATQVVAPEDRKVEEGEMIDGSTVDMEKVKKETNFEAATGSPSTDATVQGQLTGLMEDFEGGDPPPWAAGAMRAASAAMAARGLGASTMAGQAIIQAAMESALPIAQMDAATFSRFEEQNLSNKQQSAMFAAEKRAEFLGMEFTQEFQTRVANSAKISEIANINFTADQQIALENANLAQTVDLANLSASNAKVLADSAALTQVDIANLDNRQKAQVENAKSFLDMDIANLNAEQQTNLFKSQVIANSILSDAAAANATSQFNSSSKNQTDQFFANLSTSVSQFNVEQKNATSKFNAGEGNAIEQFNAAQINLREQFNTQNGLIIEQANAEWYQKIATIDNAETNQSNRDAAAAANNMSTLGFGAYMQEVRDLMSFAWQTANNDADRATTIATAKLSVDAQEAASKASKSAGMWGAIGAVAAALIR